MPGNAPTQSLTRREELRQYLATPLSERSDPLKRVFDSEAKGNVAIATQTLMPNDIVCEYRGTFMSTAEADRREFIHKANEYPAGTYVITKKQSLDPYLADGREITPADNKGVWLNHKSKFPNCKVVACRASDQSIIGLVVVAIKPVSIGDELFQDYSDRKSPDAFLRE